jgi:hypothetical protein
MTYPERRWWWRLRIWWAELPWAKEAYLDGYRMGWNERGTMPDYYNPESAWNEYVSRLGDKY